ncbi:hypothetical protein RDABS01_028707 [Bienertia sinuspersici]
MEVNRSRFVAFEDEMINSR